MNVYGIYYYHPSWQNYTTVKILCICSTLDKALDNVRKYFGEFEKNVNNSITCVLLAKPTTTILWINEYTLDELIPDVGLACNQPQNSVPIIDKLS